MMVSIILMIVIGLVMLVIGILVGYILRKSIGEKTIGNAEQKAKNMILDAENRAETVKKELVLEAKEEAHRQRNDLEKEIRERRNEIQKSERRLIQKEESIDRKLENIEKKEESIINKEKSITNKQQEMDKVLKRQLDELEKISGYRKLPSLRKRFTAAVTLSTTISISSISLNRPKLNRSAPSISLSFNPMAPSTWLCPFLLDEHAEPVDTYIPSCSKVWSSTSPRVPRNEIFRMELQH